MKRVLILLVMVLVSIALAKADCGEIPVYDERPITIEPVGSIR